MISVLVFHFVAVLCDFVVTNITLGHWTVVSFVAKL